MHIGAVLWLFLAAAPPPPPGPALLDQVQQLVAGDTYACALARDRVFCWGPTWALGGATGAREVSGLVAPVRALDAQGPTVCALESDGAVKCWGEVNGPSDVPPSEAVDPIGRGPNATRAHFEVPTRVSLPSPALAISTGYTHACAIVGAALPGDLYCWGSGVDKPYGAAPVALTAPHRWTGL